MLDLELVTPPDKTGLDIVPLAEMKKHIRIVHNKLDDVITQAIEDVGELLHGPGGKLNRSVFQCTWKRYLSGFPVDCRGRPAPILLPFPPVTQVVAITIEDGALVVDDTGYKTMLNKLVPEILPLSSWPTVTRGPRAISVTYKAGYDDYPKKLKRIIKFLAAHYMENPEATINEARQMMVNRRVDFAVDDLIDSLRVPVSYDDWGE